MEFSKEKIGIRGFVKSQVSELKSYSYSLIQLMTHLQARFEQLSAALSSTKQQLKSLNQEMTGIQIEIQDLKQKFTPELCLEISKIKNPNTTLVNLSEKILIFSNHSEPSWKVFRALIKDQEKLKNLLAQAETLTSPELSNSDHLWRSFHSVLVKIRKYPRGVRVLAKFISGLIEYKVKKTTFDDCFSEYLSYKKKVSLVQEQIVEINSQILGIEEKIADLKAMRLDTETSNSSLCSPVCTQKVRVSSNFIGRGTASGGILQGSERMPRGEEVEEYFSSKGPDVSFDVFYENSEIGCCRSKFFCF